MDLHAHRKGYLEAIAVLLTNVHDGVVKKLAEYKHLSKQEREALLPALGQTVTYLKALGARDSLGLMPDFAWDQLNPAVDAATRALTPSAFDNVDKILAAIFVGGAVANTEWVEKLCPISATGEDSFTMKDVFSFADRAGELAGGSFDDADKPKDEQASAALTAACADLHKVSAPVHSIWHQFSSKRLIRRLYATLKEVILQLELDKKSQLTPIQKRIYAHCAKWWAHKLLTEAEELRAQETNKRPVGSAEGESAYSVGTRTTRARAVLRPNCGPFTL